MNTHEATVRRGDRNATSAWEVISLPPELKIVSTRPDSSPSERLRCETPEEAVGYWRGTISSSEWFRPEQECAVVVLLNTRHRIIGHHLLAIGLLDQVLIHPRETFRAAVISAAHSIVLAHNHPSGDPTPSLQDISITRRLQKAGEVLGISLIDHVIIGNPSFASLRALGQLSD